MRGKNLLFLLIITSVVNCFSLDIGVGTSTGTYEKGKFGTLPKSFYFDYLSNPQIDKTIFFSSTSMKKEVVNGATSYYVDIEIVPGNTIYFYFGAEIAGSVIKDLPRELYVSPTWKSSETVIWSNYFNVPPKVNFSTSVVVGTGNKYKVYLLWYTPKIADVPLLDLFGGGYEIYKSTYEPQKIESYKKVAVLPTNWDLNIYTDTEISAGVTYYYLLRCYDAYTIPLYSVFSDTFTVVVSTENIVYPVKLVFNLDATKVDNVKKMFISGNFLYPYGSFYEMKEILPGKYKFEYYNELTTLVGQEIEYRYYLNEDKISDDIQRKLTIVDDDNDGVMEVNDVWGVKPVPKEFVLPEEIVSVEVSTLSLTSVNLRLELDPETTIYNLEICRVVNNNEIFVSSFDITTIKNNVVEHIDEVSPLPEKYRIKINKNIVDVPLNTSIPNNIFLGVVGETTQCLPEIQTNKTSISFVVPQKHSSYETVSYFVIRKSTFYVTSLQDYKKQSVVKKFIAHHPGSKETITISLGNEGYCPGYYITIGCVYGKNEAVGVIKPFIVVGPYTVETKNDTVVLKGNYLLGSTTGFCNAQVRLNKYSIKENVDKYSVVIKNFYELLSEPETKQKLVSAWEKLENKKTKIVSRIKPISTNNPNKFNEKNSVFSFSLYTNKNDDYFVDNNNDGLPDKILNYDAEIVIPYFDDNNDGIVDDTDIKVDDLLVCKLNPIGNFWSVVDDRPVKIDKQNKVVRLYTKEFSIYMLSGGTGGWAEDLSNVVVYPNPFVGNDGKLENGEFNTESEEYKNINFVNITKNSKLYIFNVSMDIVFEEEKIQEKANYGKYRWDMKNKNGQNVASGMYYYLIKDDTIPSGKQRVAKGIITIIR